jgi:predicted ATPase/predicted MPP superfamily phosphohydrolase
MNILHLSDLHFRRKDDVEILYTQLADDLKHNLKSTKIDLLILSGDIANVADPEEYGSAENFIKKLSREFSIRKKQIVIVPGNHDIDWTASRQSYQIMQKIGYDGPNDSWNIFANGDYIEVADLNRYKLRLKNFSDFYKRVTGHMYPQEIEEQATLHHLPEYNILVLGLNSAWQLDHNQPGRASINANAISRAMTEVRTKDFSNCLKIAVWHHPLQSSSEDRIKDPSFLQRLALNGFRLAMHGHVHKANTTQFLYDVAINGRKIDIICAGTFGAPGNQLAGGTPHQYNFLEVNDAKITVNTRRKVDLYGAWSADANWTHGAGENPLPYYVIQTKPPSAEPPHEEIKPICILPKFQPDFIGFEIELREIKKTLQDENLIIIHGNGGTGKTRIALEFAKKNFEHYSHGVCFVALDRILKAEDVPAAIARALSIKENSRNPISQQLLRYLEEKQMLIILDSFEHLVNGAGFVVDLLVKCPEIKIIITSRVMLSPAFPHIQITSLNYPRPNPPDGDIPPATWERKTLMTKKLSQFDAVKLFISIAKNKDIRFAINPVNAASIAEICYRLEGLALAVELAAAVVNRFPNEGDLLRNLSYHLLNSHIRDTTGQLMTMKSVIDWSYGRLDNEDQKVLFQQLSVFRGGFTSSSAKEVYNDGTISIGELEAHLIALQNANLLYIDRTTFERPRYKMHELIREYALSLIKNKNQVNELQMRHAKHFLKLAELAEKKITSSHRGNWLDRLDDEHANFRAAIDFCNRKEEALEVGLKICGNLFWFWNLRTHLTEGRERVETLLKKKASSFCSQEAKAKALYCAGGLAFLQGEMNTAKGYLSASIQLWNELPDDEEQKIGRGYALIVLSQVDVDLKLFDSALNQITVCVQLFEQTNDKWGLALALNDFGNVLRSNNRYSLALAEYNKALVIWERFKDLWGQPLTISNMGFVYGLLGNYTQSISLLTKSLKIQRLVGDKWGQAETLKCLGDSNLHLEKFKDAKNYYAESLRVNLTIGRRPLVVSCLKGLAVIAGAGRKFEQAIILLSITTFLREEVGEFTNLVDNNLEIKYAELSDKVKDYPELDSLYSIGKNMPLQEAVDYALAFCCEPKSVNRKADSTAKQLVDKKLDI